MPYLPPNQQHQSIEGTETNDNITTYILQQVCWTKTTRVAKNIAMIKSNSTEDEITYCSTTYTKNYNCKCTVFSKKELSKFMIKSNLIIKIICIKIMYQLCQSDNFLLCYYFHVFINSTFRCKGASKIHIKKSCVLYSSVLQFNQ